MKKLLILFIVLNIGHSNCQTTNKAEKTKGQEKHYKLSDFVFSSFCLVGGAWLSHRQLPRLAGKEIEYDSPVFTKIVAGILCTIGVAGSIFGAVNLTCIIKQKLDNSKVSLSLHPSTSSG